MTCGLYKLTDFTPPPQSDPVLSVWDEGGWGGGDLGDVDLFPCFRYGPEKSEPVMSELYHT